MGRKGNHAAVRFHGISYWCFAIGQQLCSAKCFVTINPVRNSHEMPYSADVLHRVPACAFPNVINWVLGGALKFYARESKDALQLKSLDDS